MNEQTRNIARQLLARIPGFIGLRPDPWDDGSDETEPSTQQLLDDIEAVIDQGLAKAAGASVPQEAADSRRVDRDVDLRMEMRAYLDTLITGESIGDIRRSLFVPWDSLWNGWVRDDTAARERSNG